MTSALLGQIEQLATSLPTAQIELLADHIEAFSGATDDGRASAARLVGNPAFGAAVSGLWAAWDLEPQVSGSALGLALRSAGRVADQVRLATSVEVVWTGPSSPHVPVRLSSQALLQMIDGAMTRLIVVSFAAYRVPAVEGALLRAGRRGVDVRLVLETREDSNSRLTDDAARAFDSLRTVASFWVWPGSERPEQGAAMHAKAAVCDATKALVTSANLTGSGLDRNMELGLLVTGGHVPRRLDDHFLSLMANGVLSEVKPA